MSIDERLCLEKIFISLRENLREKAEKGKRLAALFD